jgi:soluble lytic murein transglycosylase-like protein
MFVSDAWDPAQNIEGGARYLRILANQYGGDPVQVLAAYNAGPEAVRRAGGAVPNIPETQEYVRKVVELWKALEAGR